MRNHFDHLAKQIGQKALGPTGDAAAHDPINAETQYADLRYEPDPARQAERDRLGLLGRLAAVPCLIEVYSHAFNAEEFRACLAKHLTSWQGRARKTRGARRSEPEAEGSGDPFLWIITAGAPRTVLTQLELRPARDWPTGMYLFGADVLRVGSSWRASCRATERRCWSGSWRAGRCWRPLCMNWSRFPRTRSSVSLPNPFC